MATKPPKSGRRVSDPIRRELELAVIRYKILLGRMAACEDNAHELSIVEIPAWIADAKAALHAQKA
jgi:hypothetical protein